MVTEGYLLYKKGYKYQVYEDYLCRTHLRPISGRAYVATEYLHLDNAGNLIIRKGYAWDGDSGPAVDAPASRRASLEHDAKCQLMRLCLASDSYEKTAHGEYEDRIIEDGGWFMQKWARVRHWALRRFGRKSVLPSSERLVLRAP